MLVLSTFLESKTVPNVVPFAGLILVWYGVILWVLRVLGQGTGNPNAVLANRIIKCIYAVLLANKIIRCIYLCSCVFMSRFRRDLNPIRDG